ncbi:kinase-like protein [Gigaspora margarita]|nr:kinase-like protein [Gigaspora margarita]
MGNFMLVLQYATEGNLRKHLQNKQKDGVYKILWVDLIRIAKEIALGLSYLHDINIVHRDLHSMNILINNGRAMITDFGISKQLDTATTGATSSTGAKGMPAYLEPQCYIHCFPYEEKVFKLNEKSDIYSLGVLFWELTSGIPPFNNIRDNTAIIFQIAYGVREKIIENTPLGFSNLFRKCWSTEPDHRPSLIEILAELDKLSAENVEFISNNINSGSNSASSTDICPVELIEKIISEEIKVLDYNQFRVLRKIGEGGFGIVYEAEWEDRGLMVALKSFNERLHESIENILKAFIEEFKLLEKITSHPNIIDFYGVTKDTFGHYNLILQLANHGNLRDYFKENYSKLEWDTKIRIASEISDGIVFLHSNDIIHRDLHSKNILVSNGHMKIADFGLAVRHGELSRNLRPIAYGTLGYIEPKCFTDTSYKCDKKSDIYSFGMILWEISSGKPPFDSYPKEKIAIFVCNGGRETPVEGTPLQYIKLYERCWDENPENRPDAKSILDNLSHLIPSSEPDEIHFEQKKSNANYKSKSEDRLSTAIDDLTTVIDATNVDRIEETIKPFLPMIAKILGLVKEIIEIYEKAQFNKKICNSLLDRAESAEVAMNTLQRRKQRNEEKFRSQSYYNNFIKFKNDLEKIKNFAGEVTQIRGISKYLNANNIKNKFLELTRDYDQCMEDLHFTSIIAQDEQKRYDQESLKSDLNEMSEFLKLFNENVQSELKFIQGSLSILHQEVSLNETQFCHPKVKEPIDTPRIDPKFLTDIGNEEKPIKTIANSSKIMVVKKFYTKCAIEVSCEILIDEPRKFQSKKKQGYLSILGKLEECPNVLKFFGVSSLKDSTTLREHEVLVFEWADMGNLKDLYERYNIPWKTKISIAIGICRGITFLNSIDIFHHDIRCENVKMTSRLEPRLANFHFAGMSGDMSTNLEDGILNIIHWLAPEKMHEHMSLNAKKRPYTQKCEIFSFGMMLWELCFEKVPYQCKDMGYITNHVTGGGRERVPIYSGSKEEKDIHLEFIKIIKMAWAHNPDERISISKLYIMLWNMQKKYVPPGKMHDFLPHEAMKLNEGTTDEQVMSDDEYLYISEDEDIKETNEIEDIKETNEIEEILEVDQGIELHVTRDPTKRKIAWKCFVANAAKGHSKAIFWQGYYLWEGYYTDMKRTPEQTMKDRNKALHLFKMAADDGIAEAQLRYSFALKELKKLKAKTVYEEFMHYLKLAAKNGNPVAMFNLSDIYLSGKFKEKKDETTGIRYLKLAALNKNEKAITLANQKGLNIYD